MKIIQIINKKSVRNQKNYQKFERKSNFAEVCLKLSLNGFELNQLTNKFLRFFLFRTFHVQKRTGKSHFSTSIQAHRFTPLPKGQFPHSIHLNSTFQDHNRNFPSSVSIFLAVQVHFSMHKSAIKFHR